MASDEPKVPLALGRDEALVDRTKSTNVIARALVEQTAILELTDGPIDLDDTVKILESLAATLQSAGPTEVAALRSTLAEMVREENCGSGRPVFIKFYREFMYNVGIDSEPDPNGV